MSYVTGAIGGAAAPATVAGSSFATSGEKHEGSVPGFFANGPHTIADTFVNAGSGDKVLIVKTAASYDGVVDVLVGTTAGASDLANIDDITPGNIGSRATLVGLVDGDTYHVTILADADADTETIEWCVVDPFYVPPEVDVSANANRYGRVIPGVTPFDFTTWNNPDGLSLVLIESEGPGDVIYGRFNDPQTLSLVDLQARLFQRHGSGWFPVVEEEVGKLESLSNWNPANAAPPVEFGVQDGIAFARLQDTGAAGSYYGSNTLLATPAVGESVTHILEYLKDSTQSSKGLYRFARSGHASDVVFDYQSAVVGTRTVGSGVRPDVVSYEDEKRIRHVITWHGMSGVTSFLLYPGIAANLLGGFGGGVVGEIKVTCLAESQPDLVDRPDNIFGDWYALVQNGELLPARTIHADGSVSLEDNRPDFHSLVTYRGDLPQVDRKYVDIVVARDTASTTAAWLAIQAGAPAILEFDTVDDSNISIIGTHARFMKLLHTAVYDDEIRIVISVDPASGFTEWRLWPALKTPGAAANDVASMGAIRFKRLNITNENPLSAQIPVENNGIRNRWEVQDTNSSSQPANDGIFLFDLIEQTHLNPLSPVVSNGDGTFEVTTGANPVRVIAGCITEGTGPVTRVSYLHETGTPNGVRIPGAIDGIFGGGLGDKPAHAIIPPNTNITLEARSPNSASSQRLVAGAYMDFIEITAQVAKKYSGASGALAAPVTQVTDTWTPTMLGDYVVELTGVNPADPGHNGWIRIGTGGSNNNVFDGTAAADRVGDATALTMQYTITVTSLVPHTITYGVGGGGIFDTLQLHTTGYPIGALVAEDEIRITNPNAPAGLTLESDGNGTATFR